MPETKPEMDIAQLMTPIYPHEFRREIAYRNLLAELASASSNHLESRNQSEED